ncbi:hypothetical protein [Sorangium sp. So ce861]|uniref:hypothetical protein n=1 Tax=Sorangium sp. So ce861 TaxID=3133323 RepID=UPI003F626667
MDKTQAKDALKGIGGGFSKFSARAAELIDDPDQINQDQFGVCGATSIVYAMLRYDLARFIDLLKGIFDKTNFNGLRTRVDLGSAPDLSQAVVTKIDDFDILPGRIKQYKKKPSKSDVKFELDFIVSRALGKFFKELYPELYAAQKVFSTQLNVAVKEGDLALDQGALLTMLNMVGASNVIEVSLFMELPVSGSSQTLSVSGSGLVSMTQQINKINQRFANDTCRFAIVAINGAEQLGDAIGGFYSANTRYPTSADPIKVTAKPAAKQLGDPKFEHWIVLNGPITLPGDGYYHLPVWTWGFAFEMLVAAASFEDYFYTFILGSF